MQYFVLRAKQGSCLINIEDFTNDHKESCLMHEAFYDMDMYLVMQNAIMK